MDSFHEVWSEAKAIMKLCCPLAVTSLILCARPIMAVLFLAGLGGSELAAGVLATAFANITGYSVLFGLSLGMERVCSQAFGPHRPILLSITLHRTVVFLLAVSLPIALLWVNASRILIALHQDHEMSHLAHTYLLYTLPDLVSYSFMHPTCIYLRAQGLTLPYTIASVVGVILQLPVSYLLVCGLRLGSIGVATASSVANFFMLAACVLHVWWTGSHRPSWTAPTRDCLTGWGQLVRLAAPSCASVCLEWWWSYIMVLLCGVLPHPHATVPSMGALIQTIAVFNVVPSALSFAVLTRVGNELGANRPDKARASAIVAISSAGLMGLCATILLFTTSARAVLISWFVYDLTRSRIASISLPIIGLCQLGYWVQTVGCGVVRATGRPTVVAIVNLGAYYLVGMPIGVGFAFGLGIGVLGISFGLLFAQACCAGLISYVVGTTNWDQHVTRKETEATGVDTSPA